MKPEELLRSAAKAIEDRGKLRDKPDGERSMARAVDAFNGLVGGDRRLTEAEGWLFMCCLKMARGTAGQAHLDDAADLAGYAALWGECITAPQPEPHTASGFEAHMSWCSIWGRDRVCSCGGPMPTPEMR